MNLSLRFCVFGFLRQVSLHCPGWPLTPGPLPQSPECWGYRHTTTHLVPLSLFTILRLHTFLMWHQKKALNQLSPPAECSDCPGAQTEETKRVPQSQSGSTWPCQIISGTQGASLPFPRSIHVSDEGYPLRCSVGTGWAKHGNPCL